MGIWGDTIPMIGAEAYEPKDGACSIDKNTLTTLSQQIELAVGEVVAHQFLTFHTIRLEDVARLNSA